jgi:hypothetical protein
MNSTLPGGEPVAIYTIHVEEVEACFPLLTGEAAVSILVKHAVGARRQQTTFQTPHW